MPKDQEQALQREVKWDKKTAQGFAEEFFALMQKGNDAGVPNPVMEGCCRDWLGALEASRLAPHLFVQFQALGKAKQ